MRLGQIVDQQGDLLKVKIGDSQRNIKASDLFSPLEVRTQGAMGVVPRIEIAFKMDGVELTDGRYALVDGVLVRVE